MRLKPESFNSGCYYHLYNHAAQNTLLFRDDEDYEKCISLIQLHLSSQDFSLVSFCLMPNHYHFLVRQNSDCPVFYPMNRIWFSYAKYYNKKYQGMGSIFAGRLQHILIDKEIYLQRLIVYIHLNPVSANLVASPEKWMWSDYPEWINKRKTMLCDYAIRDSILESLGDYRMLAEEILEDKQMKKYLLEH